MGSSVEAASPDNKSSKRSCLRKKKKFIVLWEKVLRDVKAIDENFPSAEMKL